MREDISDHCKRVEIFNKAELKMCGYQYRKIFLKCIQLLIKHKNQ